MTVLACYFLAGRRQRSSQSASSSTQNKQRQAVNPFEKSLKRKDARSMSRDDNIDQQGEGDGSLTAVVDAATQHGERLSHESWNNTSIPKMMTPRYGLAAVTIDDRQVIALGGYDDSSGEFLSSAESIHLVPPSPTNDQEQKEEKEEQQESSWFPLPSMTTARSQFGAAAVSLPVNSSDQREQQRPPLGIIAAGGFAKGQYLDSAEMLLETPDGGNSEWVSLSPMNFARSGCAVAAVSPSSANQQQKLQLGQPQEDEKEEDEMEETHRVYVAGGFTFENGKTVYHDTVEWYDTAVKEEPSPEEDSASTWNILPATMRQGRGYCAAVMVNGLPPDLSTTGAASTSNNSRTRPLLVVMGGRIQTGPTTSTTTNSVECYCFESQRWFDLPPMSEPRERFAAVAVGPCIYVMGGYPNRKTCEFFDFRTNRWKSLPPLFTGRRGCTGVAVVHPDDGLERPRRIDVVTLGGQTADGDARSLDLVEKLYIGAGTGEHLPQIQVRLPSLRPVSLNTNTSTNNPGYDAARLTEWCSNAQMMVHGVKGEVSQVEREIARQRDAVVARLANEREKAMETVSARCEADIRAARDRFEDEVREARARREQRVQDISARASARVQQAQEEAQRMVSSVKKRAGRWIRDTERQITQNQEQVAGFMSSLGEHEQIQQTAENDLGANAHHSSTSAAPAIPTQPPPQLVCPLTQELMTDPVMAADGHTYERSAIERWFSNFTPPQNPTSPNTNVELPSRNLIPAVAMKSMCDEFRTLMVETEDDEMEDNFYFPQE